MMLPELSGALAGLEILDLDHHDRYSAAVEDGKQMGWGYYFPYLLSQNRPGRCAMLLTEDSGSLCLFRWRLRDSEPHLDLYLPPIPMSTDVLARCLERANEFNRNRSARVMRIDAKDAAAIAGVTTLRVRQRRTQYLFAPGNYENLAGKQYYTVRRNVTRIDKLPDVEVVPFHASSHAEACRELLARWKIAHRDAHGTAGGVSASRKAIEFAGKLPDRCLGGEVVLLDGRVSAFAFGGEIRPGLACSFERKCDTGVRGLSYFHLRSFLLTLRDFDLLNDGSDTGRAGLRQLKESFRPVEMHSEYRASQR